MKKLVLSAILALGAPQSAHAASWSPLDWDAMIFESQAVVEATVMSEHHEVTRPDFKPPLVFIDRADVKVEKTLLGADLTGKTLNIGDVALYQKWTAMRFIENPPAAVFQPPSAPLKLETGDRAIFFLESADSSLNLAAENLSLEGFFPASNAPIARKEVLGSIEINSAGGYGEMRGVSRAVFNTRFAASLARVAELKTKLSAPVDVKNRAFFSTGKSDAKITRKSRSGSPATRLPTR